MRGVVRILLPLSVVGALVLVACGVIQNFAGIHEVGQFMGGSRQWNGGAAASQEVIKELGTNGGGCFNANSAHPFENPTPFSNLFEILLILVVPFALTRTFGRRAGNPRQSYAILAAMAAVRLGTGPAHLSPVRRPPGAPRRREERPGRRAGGEAGRGPHRRADPRLHGGAPVNVLGLDIALKEPVAGAAARG